MKKLLSTILISLSSPSIYANSFEDFMTDVYENSPFIGVEKQNYEAAKERFGAQKLYFIPKVKSENTLSKDAYYNSDEESKLNLNVESLLYSSDRKHIISEFEINVINSENTLRSKLQDIEFNVKRSVIEIQEYQKLLKAVDSLVKDTNDLQNRIEKRVKNGASLASDLSQVRLLSSRIKNEITILEKNINMAKINISNVSGIDYPNSGISMIGNYEKELVDFYPKFENLKNNFGYLNLKHNSQIAKRKMLQSDPLFNVSLSGDYNSTKNDKWDNEFLVELNVNVNIFDYGKRSEEKAYGHLYEASKLELDYFYKTLVTDLEEYIFLDSTYSSELKNLDYQITQSNDIVSEHEKQYNIGRVSLYEMLNTKFDLFSQQLNRTNTYISYLKNKTSMMETAREVK